MTVPIAIAPERNSAAGRALSLLTFMRVDATTSAITDILIGSWMTGTERGAQVAYGVDELGYTWEALSDPVRAPLWALPHAAQYTGGNVPARFAGETDEDYLTRARVEVVSPAGMRRGTVRALIARMQTLLLATRYVSIVEWVDGSPWKLVARVHDSECPDPAALYEAANSPDAIPAGMHIEIVLSTGPVWDEAPGSWDTTTSTWDDLL